MQIGPSSFFTAVFCFSETFFLGRIYTNDLSSLLESLSLQFPMAPLKTELEIQNA